jgi:hypothetical protein
MAISAVLVGGGLLLGQGQKRDAEKIQQATDSITAATAKAASAAPPMPVDQQQAAQDAANTQKAQLAKNAGRQSTILTSPTGLGTTNPANLQYRTLLGQ